MKALLARTVVLSLLLPACGQPSEPAQGTLKVYTGIAAASRVAEDTDGVDILIDDATPVHVSAAGDSVIQSSIRVGSHTIEVQGVRSTCTLFFPNPGTLVVRRDSTTSALLQGICQ